jgi:hypothetical protein
MYASSGSGISMLAGVMMYRPKEKAKLTNTAKAMTKILPTQYNWNRLLIIYFLRLLRRAVFMSFMIVPFESKVYFPDPWQNWSAQGFSVITENFVYRCPIQAS